MSGSPEWSDSETAILRGLWDTEMPCSEIGRAMGKTKNSIIGKSKRIGLPRRPSVVHVSPQKRAERRAKRANKTAQKEAAQKQIEDHGKALTGEAVQPEGCGCRWIDIDPSNRPDGMPIEGIFCNREIYKNENGKKVGSYCFSHRARAYLPRKEKKEPGTCLEA